MGIPTLRIEFPELPLRPESLTEDRLAKVFGGCGNALEHCLSDKDCCENYWCKANAFCHSR